MKKKTKLLLSFVFILCLLLCLGLSASAAEVYASGVCGDNVTWTLYDDGDLVISGEGAMYYDESLVDQDKVKNVIIEDGVTSIGYCAFMEYKNLESVTIPGSVKNIEMYAFLYCRNLETVIMENGVENICTAAFMECHSLKSITIPESVMNIEMGAFVWTSALENFTVDENNKYYSSDDYGVLFNKDKSTLIAYPAGSKETSYVVPKGVTDIEEFAFAMCTNLESIVIADSVRNIDESAFAFCEALTDVTLGCGITKIGYFFEGCEFITTVTIPSSVTSIESYAFDECVDLKTVYYGGTKAQWDAITIDENNDPLYSATIIVACGHEDADENGYCDNCDEIFVIKSEDCGAEGDNVIWTLYSNGDLVISGTGDMGRHDIYKYDDKIKNVIIEDGVTSIADRAFDSCDKIVSVTIPDTVTSIGDFAFSGCFNLGNIIIPDSVTTIGEFAFASCLSFTDIVIPDSVTNIGTCAFGNLALKSITLPDNLTSIPDYMFFECYELAEIVIPDSVTSIGLCAFAWCPIKEITIPENVSSIGEAALGCCFELTTITVDEKNEFYTSYNGVLFNKDMTQLVAYPSGITEGVYVIPEGVIDIAYGAFVNNANLTGIVIPYGVTEIGKHAFSECENLTDVTIPDSVTVIDTNAFYGCISLESITIPNSVTNIGSGAFAACSSLTDVYFDGTEEQWKNIVFDEYNENILDATIHFPHTHTPGEWEVDTEATYEADGKKVQKCTGCGEVLAEEVIPQLVRVTVEDNKTGVAIEFDSDEYDGEVEVAVEETFDGKAFEIINASVGSTKATVFDISMTLNDTAIQPNGKITVKIPLPEGYDAALCVIYYLNTENGTIEAFETKYEDGYLVFETDHFSYYAVVEVPAVDDDTDNDNGNEDSGDNNVTDNCSCMCHKGGFMAFIWKIVSFLWRLFGMNPVCACGVSHY